MLCRLFEQNQWAKTLMPHTRWGLTPIVNWFKSPIDRHCIWTIDIYTNTLLEHWDDCTETVTVSHRNWNTWAVIFCSFVLRCTLLVCTSRPQIKLKWTNYSHRCSALCMHTVCFDCSQPHLWVTFTQLNVNVIRLDIVCLKDGVRRKLRSSMVQYLSLIKGPTLYVLMRKTSVLLFSKAVRLL